MGTNSRAQMMAICLISMLSVPSCKSTTIRRPVSPPELTDTNSRLVRQLQSPLPNVAQIESIRLPQYSLGYLTADAQVEPERYHYRICTANHCTEGDMNASQQVLAPLQAGNYTIYVSACPAQAKDCGPETQLSYSQPTPPNAEILPLLTKIKSTNLAIRTIGKKVYSVLEGYRSRNPSTGNAIDQSIDIELLAGKDNLAEMINSSTFTKSLLSINNIKDSLEQDAKTSPISIEEINEVLANDAKQELAAKTNSALVLVLGSTSFITGFIFSGIGFSFLVTARNADARVSAMHQAIDTYLNSVKELLTEANDANLKGNLSLQFKLAELSQALQGNLDSVYGKSIKIFGNRMFQGLNLLFGMSEPMRPEMVFPDFAKAPVGKVIASGNAHFRIIDLGTQGKRLEVLNLAEKDATTVYAEEDGKKFNLADTYLVRDNLLFKPSIAQSNLADLASNLPDDVDNKILVSQANNKPRIFRINKRSGISVIEELLPKKVGNQIDTNPASYDASSSIFNTNVIDGTRVYALGLNAMNFEIHEGFGQFNAATMERLQKLEAELFKEYRLIDGANRADMTDMFRRTYLVDSAGNLLAPPKELIVPGVNYFAAGQNTLTVDGVTYTRGGPNVKEFPEFRNIGQAPWGLQNIADFANQRINGSLNGTYLYLQYKSQVFTDTLRVADLDATSRINQIRAGADALPETIKSKAGRAIQIVEEQKAVVERLSAKNFESTRTATYRLSYALIGIGLISTVVGAVTIGVGAQASLAGNEKADLLQSLSDLTAKIIDLHRYRLNLLASIKKSLGMPLQYDPAEDEWIFWL